MLDFEKGERDTRHYEFNLEGLNNFDYDVGDCLAVYPQNQMSDVEHFLQKMQPHWGIDTNSLITVNSQPPEGMISPPNMTAGQVFTQVLDIFGKPGRRFW